MGKASPTEGTLPGALYFILKYADQKEGLKKALQGNTMVGGDNASRAIAIGMVLGAYKGQVVPLYARGFLSSFRRAVLS